VDPSYSQHNSKKNMRTKNTISTPPRTLEEISTALLSGLVNGLLATGFNCVKATLIFGQSHLTTMWIPVGVCMYHFATIVAGPSTTTFSDCRIAIGGPNIKHPLLFGPTIASAIVTSITGIESSSHRRSLAVSGGMFTFPLFSNTTTLDLNVTSRNHRRHIRLRRGNVTFVNHICHGIFNISYHNLLVHTRSFPTYQSCTVLT
jgi:hypothetical protein